MRCLVEAGSEINSSNRDGRTPLHYAVNHDKFDIVQYLLWKSANVTSEIHLAVLLGSYKLVQLLVQNGASPSIQSIEKLFAGSDDQAESGFMNPSCKLAFENVLCILGERSPLFVALQHGRGDMARFFIHNHFLSWFDVTCLPFSF